MSAVVTKTLAKPSAQTYAPPTHGEAIQTLTFARMPGQAPSVVFGPKGVVPGRRSSPAQAEDMSDLLLRLKNEPNKLAFDDDAALMDFLDRD